MKKKQWKKGVNGEPVYNNKYINAKLKLHNGRINASFYDNKIPKESLLRLFLLDILRLYC